MEKKYWDTKWQNKDTGWDQQKPNPFLLKYFNNLNLKTGATIFVPLCGKSIDMLWLTEQGYQVIGVELNLQACELFFTENNIPYQTNQLEKFNVLSSDKITLLSGDFFDLDKNILGQIDAIYDRAALIALPVEIRQVYAQKITNLVAPHTQILLITPCYNQQEMQGPPFSVNEDEVQDLFGKNFNVLQLYHQVAENIPAHLQARGLTHASDLVFQIRSVL